MDRVILQPFEDLRLLQGHPWVYDNEIARVEGTPNAGDVVDVESANKKYIGRGFFNPNSKIRVRLTTSSKDGIDRGYIKRRIKQALEYRSLFLDIEKESFRLVFAESDFLPGLIIDLFHVDQINNSLIAQKSESSSDNPCGVFLSVQFLSYGMNVRKDDVVSVLVEMFNPLGIVERSDASVRTLEGLTEEKGILFGSVPDEIIFLENNLKFSASLLHGQKTGWFLDQRENRLCAAQYLKGRKILDAFCNAGGFGIHAACLGSDSVIAADSSKEALDLVVKNAKLNGVENKVSVLEADIFELLASYTRSKEKFSGIILDPPAFAKNRSQVDNAVRGYKEINVKAMKLIEKGGILVSSSCSHYMTDELFMKMLKDSAADAQRPLHIIEKRVQSKDHPILSGYDESLYLKCVIMQVL